MPAPGLQPVTIREMHAVFAWVGKCPRDKWATANNTTAIVQDTNGTRWRATVYDSAKSLHATFRLMPNKVPSLRQLGLPNNVRLLASQSSGLVIVAGMTRSGRTTTLAAMLGLINATREAHILTIEHPVEYLHQPKVSLISQRDVKPENRKKMLQVTLNSDLDVIMVGDSVTAEDFEFCITLASAGYLVLTSAHACDSVAVCEHIATATGHQGHMMLSHTLKGVITQRLIPDAKDPRGHQAIAEVLMITPSLRTILKPGNDMEAIRSHIINQKINIDYLLATKCSQGDITEEAARASSVNPELFDSLLHQALIL